MGANRTAFAYPWELQSANVSPSVVGTAIASFDTFLDLLAVVAPANGVQASTAGASEANDGLGDTYAYRAIYDSTPIFPTSGRPVGDTTGAWVSTKINGSQSSTAGEVTGPLNDTVVAKLAGASVPANAPAAGDALLAATPTALAFGPPANAIASVTGLSALTAVSSVAKVLGGYAANADEGGGVFVLIPGSTDATDNGTVVAVSGGRAKRVYGGEWLNVKWFGAKGDGTTNDTVAVQAAFTVAVAASRGARVFFPPGTYLVDQITITSAYPLTIEGAGKASQIKGNSCDSALCANASAGNLRIRNLGFAGTLGRAIYAVANTGAIEITGCDIAAMTMAPSTGVAGCVVISGCSDVTITGNDLHDCGLPAPLSQRVYGIYLDPPAVSNNYRVQVRTNKVRSSTITAGISLFDTSDSSITDNEVDLGIGSISDAVGGDGHGIIVYRHGTSPATYRVDVSGNRVSNCAGNGIYIQDVSRCTVQRNIVTDCGLVHINTGALLCAGIALASSPLTTVSGNVIKGGYRNGIAWQGADIKIGQNTIEATGDHGMQCTGVSARSTIAGNAVSGVLGRNAVVQSATASATFATVAAGETLTFKINGGSTITATMVSGDVTGTANVRAAKIAARIVAAATSAGYTCIATASEDVSLTSWVAGTLNSIVIQSRVQGTGSHVEIVGGTARAKLSLTIAVVDGAATYPIFTSSNAVTNSQFTGNSVSNGTIAGAAGMYFNNVSNCVFDGNAIDGTVSAVASTPYGLALIAGTNNVVRGNQVASCTVDGIYLAGTGTLAQCNVSTGHGRYGMNDIGGVNQRFIDNVLTGNTTAAIGSSGTNLERRGNVCVDATALRASNATLATGTKDVSNAEVKAAFTKIRLTRTTAGASPGHLRYTVTDGHITIDSSDAGDTGHVDWEIVH